MSVVRAVGSSSGSCIVCASSAMSEAGQEGRFVRMCGLSCIGWFSGVGCVVSSTRPSERHGGRRLFAS